jgi:hypothetical protein
MSQTDARLGQRLSAGMGITQATREDDDGATMMAESNAMVDRDEDYNTRYAGYKGNLLAFERTKLIPRKTATINLTTMTRSAGADTPDKIVDYFTSRFLSGPLGAPDRALLVGFIEKRLGAARAQAGPELEDSLRELLYLVFSLPEYQLS